MTKSKKSQKLSGKASTSLKLRLAKKVVDPNRKSSTRIVASNALKMLKDVDPATLKGKVLTRWLENFCPVYISELKKLKAAHADDDGYRKAKNTLRKTFVERLENGTPLDKPLRKIAPRGTVMKRFVEEQAEPLKTARDACIDANGEIDEEKYRLAKGTIYKAWYNSQYNLENKERLNKMDANRYWAKAEKDYQQTGVWNSTVRAYQNDHKRSRAEEDREHSKELAMEVQGKLAAMDEQEQATAIESLAHVYHCTPNSMQTVKAWMSLKTEFGSDNMSGGPRNWFTDDLAKAVAHMTKNKECIDGIYTVIRIDERHEMFRTIKHQAWMDSSKKKLRFFATSCDIKLMESRRKMVAGATMVQRTLMHV
eukprot:g64.t1